MIDTTGSGAERIIWAARSMPVLRAIAERVKRAGTLAGLRVGVSLVLEPKTANLALALRDAGAEVVVYCNASSTDQQVVEALREQGFSVFADSQATEAEELQLARDFLETGLDILIDDGASVTRLAHREYPELVAKMIGAAEETTSGVRPLRVMHEEGELKLPVIAVNDSAAKYLFDNIYGTGQSCVMAFVDITNLQLAGRRVVVVGYGWVGMGVAKYAAALGARVIVSEIDPIRALRALHDGYEVTAFREAAATAEVVFSCTGLADAVTAEHVELLPEGAFLCTAGGGDFEMPMDYLHGLGDARHVRHAVTAYTSRAGRTVNLISEGDCLNCADAEGNPIEVMDLSLSLQALAVERLAAGAKDWEPGVYDLPEDIEQEVARIRLEAAGGSLESLTDRQREAARAW
ncbi:adenosylhomocysteinase [Leucobacter aridicollis]|uniref:Adenosylhomocysteinase n=1 Tax=Leucobacter aridicollis TaxID=283878 RepID=A0A852R3A5_9MICO|nr:adenosylhomocysteinase [Leucobacter aridicollis]MBL3681794.1 adenosylhomocysteinase [Leucobacter aridicollis]NYD27167.1 adenosylhomocysteinase [Leucobacter aridicollis]